MCMNPGPVGVAAAPPAVASVSLALRWTVEPWITSPLDGETMMSLAGLAGREEDGGGAAAGWRPPPHAEQSRIASTATSERFIGLILRPADLMAGLEQAGSRDHGEAHRGRDRWAEGHPRQILFTTRAGRGRPGLAADRHCRTQRPRRSRPDGLGEVPGQRRPARRGGLNAERPPPGRGGE